MKEMIESFRSKFGIGEYPPEYNPKVHGPYYPNRYYGKVDTKFSDVKLGEMTEWISRGNLHPFKLLKGLARASWDWKMKWMMVSKPTLVPYVQVAMGLSLVFFLSQYPKYRTLGHHHTKYHW